MVKETEYGGEGKGREENTDTKLTVTTNRNGTRKVP
jgi:hypothetical protein